MKLGRHRPGGFEETRRWKPRLSLAFTLPEVLVAIALVGIMVAALYGGMTSSTLSVTLAREDLRATQVMLEKLEIVRSYTWAQLFPNVDPDESDEDDGDTFDPDDPDYVEDDIPFTIPKTFTAPFIPGDPDNGGFVYNGNIAIVPAPLTEQYSNSLAQVTIEVIWTSGGITRTRQMRSFFAQYGMQNNITR